MLASSRNLAAAEGPKRRAKTPALHCGREREVIRKRQLFVRSVGGSMQASAPTQGAGCRSRLRYTCTLYCRAGVHSRRGGWRRGDAVVLCKRRAARLGRIETPRKGIGKVMCRTPQSADAITGLRYPHHAAHAEACLHSATAAPAPSRCIRRRRRSTPQPLAGEPFGWKPFAPAQTPASRISPLRKAMSAPAGRSRRARVRRASSGAISTHCTRRLSQVVQYRRRLSAHRTTLYTV